MKAYYPLTANGNDLAGALSGGTLANCVGLCLIGAAAGLYQLQKAPLYGECGTFSDIGAPVSGSGTAQFSDTSTTQSCYRVSVNSGAAFSTVAKAPPSLQRSY